MKLSVKEQRELIPDAAVKAIFMERDDIKQLSKTDREKRWREHKKRLDKFRRFLARCDAPAILWPDKEEEVQP